MLQRPSGYHQPDEPSRDECQFSDMLKPLAYAVWVDPVTRNAVMRAMRVTEPLDDLGSYCRWLTQRARPTACINLVRLPLFVHPTAGDA